jgi:hypothetical protein
MNQEKFKTFSEAYRVGLQEAVAKDPEKYFTQGATPEKYAEVVSARMLESIGGGKHFGVNYEGGGFRRACKALGIKHTRKAILEYLEIPTK